MRETRKKTKKQSSLSMPMVQTQVFLTPGNAKGEEQHFRRKLKETRPPPSNLHIYRSKCITNQFFKAKMATYSRKRMW
jgi:hypothetical protein